MGRKRRSRNAIKEWINLPTRSTELFATLGIEEHTIWKNCLETQRPVINNKNITRKLRVRIYNTYTAYFTRYKSSVFCSSWCTSVWQRMTSKKLADIYKKSSLCESTYTQMKKQKRSDKSDLKECRLQTGKVKTKNRILVEKVHHTSHGPEVLC